MSAPHLGALSGLLPPLRELGPRAGEATIAVHDEGDHMAAYLAPAPLDCLVGALARDTRHTAWDALGRPLRPGMAVPEAGEAIEGALNCTLPTSLRAHPRAVLASGSEWVICVEDGVHATLFTRRASLVLRAVQATIARLLATSTHPSPRIDPRLLGTLSRPTFRGAHTLRLDHQHAQLWVRSPQRIIALAPNRRGSWQQIP